MLLKLKIVFLQVIFFFFWLFKYKKTNSFIISGDTLFIGGAGRFFEGNAKEMLENMDFIASLPDDVHILCGHEYTFDNYKWGKEIEPDNEQIQI